MIKFDIKYQNQAIKYLLDQKHIIKIQEMLSSTKNKNKIFPDILKDKNRDSNISKATKESQTHLPQAEKTSDNFMNQSQVQLAKKQCKICCEFSKKLYLFSSCGHMFCQVCCIKYINSRMEQKLALTCPNLQCESKIKVIESQKHKQESQEHYFFQQLRRKQKKRLIQYQKDLQRQKKLAVKCDKCIYQEINQNKKIKFCQSCLKLELPDDIKQCPKCERLLEKKKGCNHIKCLCEYQFCFDCKEEWKDQHICQHRIQNRTGISYVICFIIKILIGIPIAVLLLAVQIIFGLTFCCLSAFLCGFIAFIKINQFLSTHEMNNCLKFLLFILTLLCLPIIFTCLMIPGFFIPFINVCYKQKIVFDPSILQTTSRRIFMCLNILRLL